MRVTATEYPCAEAAAHREAVASAVLAVIRPRTTTVFVVLPQRAYQRLSRPASPGANELPLGPSHTRHSPHRWGVACRIRLSEKGMR